MAEKQLYQGVCVGGPLDGQTRESRYPKGALLVNKPGGSAWVYDYQAGDEPRFVAREQAPL